MCIENETDENIYEEPDGCIYDCISCYHTCEGCRYGALKCPYCDTYVSFEDRLFEEDSICPYCDELVEWGDVD